MHADQTPTPRACRPRGVPFPRIVASSPEVVCGDLQEIALLDVLSTLRVCSPWSAAGFQERVLAAVTALREPYRGAIYMRYYQGMTPTAIAAELKVPVATIDSQLLRGRALIREQLNREFGDNRVWLSALIPLCPPNLFPPPVHVPVGPIASLGALGMKLAIAVAASITVISAALLTTLDSGETEASQPSFLERADLEPVEAPTESGLTAPLVGKVAPGSKRAKASASSEDEPEELVAAVPATLGLGGVVLDLD